MPEGKLVVVGTGIYAGHITVEAKGWIVQSDHVVYCVSDPVTERWLLKMRSDAESLYPYYDEGKNRRDTYREMTNRILELVRDGLTVCAVFYGHPGFFVAPSHNAIQAAVSEGYSARMLPGISSVDCLFCDLAVEAASGCQIFEATDFVLRQRTPDPTTHLIILQVASIGEIDYKIGGWSGHNVSRLRDYLLNFYSPDHRAKFYAAPQFPLCEPTINEVELRLIGTEEVVTLPTLYVPPSTQSPIALKAMEDLSLQGILEGRNLTPLI